MSQKTRGSKGLQAAQALSQITAPRAPRDTFPAGTLRLDKDYQKKNRDAPVTTTEEFAVNSSGFSKSIRAGEVSVRTAATRGKDLEVFLNRTYLRNYFKISDLKTQQRTLWWPKVQLYEGVKDSEHPASYAYMLSEFEKAAQGATADSSTLY